MVEIVKNRGMHAPWACTHKIVFHKQAWKLQWGCKVSCKVSGLGERIVKNPAPSGLNCKGLGLKL